MVSKKQRVLPSVENIKADLHRVSVIAEEKVIGSITMLSNIQKRYSMYLSKFLKQKRDCKFKRGGRSTWAKQGKKVIGYMQTLRDGFFNL